MTDSGIAITGGAGVLEAAAVIAVLQYVLEGESSARSHFPAPRVNSAWVRAGAAKPFGRYSPPVLPDPGRNAPS